MRPASLRSSARTLPPDTAARRTRRRGSEDFWTPGMSVPAKQRVRAHQRAVLQLLRPAGPRERGERNPAEISRAEGLRRQRDVRIVVRPRGRAVLELPASLVPRAEIIVDVE